MTATCPDCGKAVKERGLGPHRRLAHGYRREDPARPGPDADGFYHCPECPNGAQGFRKSAHLGTHRQKIHGIDGTSAASASRARRIGRIPPRKIKVVPPSRYCAMGRHRSCTMLFGGIAPCGCACHPPKVRRRRSTVPVTEQPTPPSAEGFSGPQA